MKFIRKSLLMLAIAFVMLGLGSSNHEVQAQAQLQTQANWRQEITNSQLQSAKPKKKNRVVKIHAKYNPKAKVRNGRRCNNYFQEEMAQIREVYGVNAKGQRVKDKVEILESGKFLTAHNGKVYLTLKCQNKTRRLEFTNIIPVTKVTAKVRNVSFEEGKLTKSKAKKIRFLVEWKNGKKFNYKGAECLDIGKTIRGKSCKVRYRIGNKIITVKVPVTKQKPKPTHIPQQPTEKPTQTPEPSKEPTQTPNPTQKPTQIPEPSKEPTQTPQQPTEKPTQTPEPSKEPTQTPQQPTEKPTQTPEPSKIPEEHQHNWEEWNSKDDNEHERQCLECKEKESKPHEWGIWEYNSDTGLEERECLICKTKDFQDHQHKWEEWNSKDDKEHKRECFICQEEESKPHEWGAWKYDSENSTKERECQICKTKDTQDHQHSWGEWYSKDGNEHERQCLECQEKESKPHEWGVWEYNSDTGLEERECQICKTKESQDHQHSWGEWYSKDGNEHERQCLLCAEKESYSHEWGDWKYNKDTGLEERECQICKTKEPQDHQHSWGEWYSKDGNEHERQCSICAEKESYSHEWGVWEYNSDTGLDERVCQICKTTEPRDHQHSWGEWISKDNAEHERQCGMCAEKESYSHEWEDWSYNNENGLDERVCQYCKELDSREHQHLEPPTDLQYTLKSSNRNNTHKMGAEYICEICQKTIVLTKDEACLYGDVFYERTGVNDTHTEVRICQVCQYRKTQDGTCKPVGELKYIKVAAQVYEYFDCGLCGDWCKRAYHTEHHFGNWEYYDEYVHKRYCGCVEGREEEEHNYVYDKNTSMISCDVCADAREVESHEHGYNTVDEMGLMNIIQSPAYAEILDHSQIVNPNPSAGSWCSRYEFRCQICGVKYYIHYAHKFENGVCTRKGYCGGIAQIAR